VVLVEGGEELVEQGCTVWVSVPLEFGHFATLVAAFHRGEERCIFL